MRLARPVSLLSGMGLLLCLSAQAAETPAPQTKQPVSQEQVGAGNDVNVGIDPKTKKLRPLNAAETKTLAEKANAMAKRRDSQWDKAPKTAAEARATLRTHAGGAQSMQVPTDAMSAMTVSRDADGRLHFSEGDAHPAPAATQEVGE